MATILIVDDSLIIHRTLGLIIRKMDHDVLTAENGRKALEFLDQYPVDLAIIDISMPEMDGLELVAHIRANATLDKLPIAFLTGSGQERDRQAALDLGVSIFLDKPVSSNHLREIIHDMLTC
ncbi:MAG: response regulator [Candidatus Promineifilaceae bacterium]